MARKHGSRRFQSKKRQQERAIFASIAESRRQAKMSPKRRAAERQANTPILLQPATSPTERVLNWLKGGKSQNPKEYNVHLIKKASQLPGAITFNPAKKMYRFTLYNGEIIETDTPKLKYGQRYKNRIELLGGGDEAERIREFTGEQIAIAARQAGRKFDRLAAKNLIDRVKYERKKASEKKKSPWYAPSPDEKAPEISKHVWKNIKNEIQAEKELLPSQFEIWKELSKVKYKDIDRLSDEALTRFDKQYTKLSPTRKTLQSDVGGASIRDPLKMRKKSVRLDVKNHAYDSEHFQFDKNRVSKADLALLEIPVYQGNLTDPFMQSPTFRRRMDQLAKDNPEIFEDVVDLAKMNASRLAEDKKWPSTGINRIKMYLRPKKSIKVAGRKAYITGESTPSLPEKRSNLFAATKKLMKFGTSDKIDETVEQARKELLSKTNSLSKPIPYVDMDKLYEHIIEARKRAILAGHASNLNDEKRNFEKDSPFFQQISTLNKSRNLFKAGYGPVERRDLVRFGIRNYDESNPHVRDAVQAISLLHGNYSKITAQKRKELFGDRDGKLQDDEEIIITKRQEAPRDKLTAYARANYGRLGDLYKKSRMTPPSWPQSDYTYRTTRSSIEQRAAEKAVIAEARDELEKQIPFAYHRLDKLNDISIINREESRLEAKRKYLKQKVDNIRIQQKARRSAMQRIEAITKKSEQKKKKVSLWQKFLKKLT